MAGRYAWPPETVQPPSAALYWAKIGAPLPSTATSPADARTAALVFAVSEPYPPYAWSRVSP